MAQAVDAVVFSDSLPGKKCAYFSSAGNQQGGGWMSTLDRVFNSTARGGLPTQNLKLGQVPVDLTSGGFHDFNPKGGTERDISQTFNIPAGTPDSPSFVLILFQWDDPFNLRNGVTTDYNLLVFDGAGNYIPQFSGIDDNTATQQPFEAAIFVNAGPATTFQIAIARAGNSSSQPVAKRLRYLAIDQFNSGYGAAEYYQEDAPTTFGHNSARGAIGTAAYVYDDNPSNPPAPPYTPAVESFTSSGPVTIALDSNGHRFPNPVIRQKPDLAAPDGGNTTFFGFDYEGDGFPNFFGTSAAAPHAAGAAALLLQQAGGPRSLTATQIRKTLQASAGPHDLNSFFIQAIAGPFDNATVVTGHGNSSTASSQDRNFFTIDFHGMQGNSLRSLTIDIADAGLKFDTTTVSGYPFTLGNLEGVTASDISTNAPRRTVSFTRFTLTFDRNTFNPNDSVSFGLDRDIFGDGGGNTADLLQGAHVIARTWSDSGTESGEATFQNTFGLGYAIEDGFGLIDAAKAANNLK